MAQADYAVIQVDYDRVFLVDLALGGKSVTDDVKAVCEELQYAYRGRRVIYRDRFGLWTEMRIGVRNDVLFAPYDEYVPDCEIESL